MQVAVFLERKAEGAVGIGSNAEVEKRISDALGGAEVYTSETPDGSDLIEKGVDAEVVVAFGAGRALKYTDYLRQLTNLRWIHNVLSGSEAILSSDYLKTVPGLLLTNSRGVHGIPMADHVMGGILYFTRNFHRFTLRNRRERSWERDLPSETTGKTLGILGMGQIGREIATRAKAFNMTVLGVKRTPEDIPYVDELLTDDRMDEAIARSDYLVMLVPASERTAKLMNAEKFALMKPGSIFINVGRGKTVDNAALFDALKTGKIAGALIDAYDPEPVPADDPLWELENVLITPHCAADSEHYMDRMLDVFAENAARFLKGEELLTRIYFD